MRELVGCEIVEYSIQAINNTHNTLFQKPYRKRGK